MPPKPTPPWRLKSLILPVLLFLTAGLPEGLRAQSDPLSFEEEERESLFLEPEEEEPGGEPARPPEHAVTEYRLPAAPEDPADPSDPSELKSPPPISVRTIPPGLSGRPEAPGKAPGSRDPGAPLPLPAPGGTVPPKAPAGGYEEGSVPLPPPPSPAAPFRTPAEGPAGTYGAVPPRATPRTQAPAPPAASETSAQEGAPKSQLRPQAPRGSAPAPAQAPPASPAPPAKGGAPKSPKTPPGADLSPPSPSPKGAQASPATPEAAPVRENQAAAPGVPAGTPPANPASRRGAEDIRVPYNPGREVTADNVEEVLSLPLEGEVEGSGGLLVWRENKLYRRNPDGGYTLVDNTLDVQTDEYGQKWLDYDEAGNAIIQVSLKVWATINFAYDSTEIDADSVKVLEAFGRALNSPALKNSSLLIAGHTDNNGSDGYNIKLSRERANAVSLWLTENMGIAQERLICSGYGANNPIADNATVEGQAKNRRVEFVLLPEVNEPS